MPDDMIAADIDVLAGEYVLGTLASDERAAAQKLIAEDSEFAAKVRVWERRLGELHLMVEPIEPEPDVWSRIGARLPERKPQLPPEPEPQPEPHPEPRLNLPEFKFDWDPQAQPAREPQLEPSSEPRRDPEPDPHPELDFAPTRPPEPAVASPEAVPAPEELTAPATSEAIELPAAEPPPIAPAEVKPVKAEPAKAEPVVAEPVSEAGKPPESPIRLPSFIAPKPARTAEIIETERKLRSLRRHLAGWRVLAAVLALGVVAAAGLVAVWRYAPERVPPALRPVELMRLAGISVGTGAPPRRPAPPESQFDE
jgi:hypothetical protein